MRRVVIGIVAFALAAGAAGLRVSLNAAPGQSAAPAPATAAASTAVQEGHLLFRQYCVLCHQPGPYEGEAFGPLLGNTFVENRQQARDAIMKGMPPLMPGFQYAFNATQVDAIIAYLATIDPNGPRTVTTPKPTSVKASPSTSQVYFTGNVKSAKGENLEGVTVYAKRDGSTITTTVFTDKEGNYYFPQMAGGTYRVWAQAIGFEPGRAQVTTAGALQRQNFQLKDTTNFLPQLSGGQWAAALPIDTPNHRRMRDLLLHTCTTCHALGFTLQNRYDEAGWDALLSRMVPIRGNGIDTKRDDLQMKHYQKELVAYLTEMRGPGPSPMKFTVPARPSGPSTLPVVYQYDIPSEEFGGYNPQDGTDWSRGTPSHVGGVMGIHDALIDFNSNIWFSYYLPSRTRSYGRIDTKTGEITNFTAAGTEEGFVANTHGMMRTPDGNIWTTVSEQGVGLIDVKTGKLKVLKAPKGITAPGIDVDYDDNGVIWTGSPNGAARVDPKTGEWKYFKSLTPGQTYGVAVQRNGTAWWAQINIDKMSYTDGTTVKEIDIPRNTNEKFISEKDLTPADLEFFKTGARPNSNTFAPWAQGPRRIAIDKNGDDLWVCMFNGSNLMRLNTRTKELKIYPLPGTSVNTYMPAVDSNHNVWVSSQGDDSLYKFDPKTEQFTTYQWPVRSAAQRHNSVSDRNGVVEVVTAHFGSGNVGRMVMRTERDLETLKAQVQAAAR